MIDAQGNYVPDVTPVTTTNNPVPPTTVTSSIPVPTPAQIYSASNIAQATNAPVAPPDLSNASAIYNYYLGGADVTSARTAAEADAAALAKAKATARNRQLAIEGNPLESQQFIVGQQARAGQLDNAALNALADIAGVSSANYASAKQTASEKANIALSQRSELVSLITLNPGAKITFNDTIESATGKIKSYNDKVAKDNQKKADEEYKKSLKAELIKLGISNKTSKGGTMSVKSMEKALASEYKSKSDFEKKLNSLKLKSATEKISELQAVDNAWKKTGGNWDEMIKSLQGKYDVSSGSVIDNEIRRRNGLAPINTKSGDNNPKSIGKDDSGNEIYMLNGERVMWSSN